MMGGKHCYYVYNVSQINTERIYEYISNNTQTQNTSMYFS